MRITTSDSHRGPQPAIGAAVGKPAAWAEPHDRAAAPKGPQSPCKLRMQAFILDFVDLSRFLFIDSMPLRRHMHDIQVDDKSLRSCRTGRYRSLTLQTPRCEKSWASSQRLTIDPRRPPVPAFSVPRAGRLERPACRNLSDLGPYRTDDLSSMTTRTDPFRDLRHRWTDVTSFGVAGGIR